jgi:secreted trypsin-like serine protease
MFDSKGDSGGPLVQTRGIRTYQIGLVSFGIPCAVKELPGVYTHLGKFYHWIQDNMV